MMRMLLCLAAVLFVATGPAGAHAFLEHSSPGAGAILTASPKVVTLDFSEQLEPAFSDTIVSDSTRHAVTSASAKVAEQRMSLALPDLKPGKYRVTWHAVSVDTHRTQGSFTFTVKP